MLGAGIFGPSDPLAGGPADCGCCCCEDSAHERWRGPPRCFSLVRLASFCRPLILLPGLDTLAAILVWAVLGNGDSEKRLRQLGVPRSKGGLRLAALYRARGMGPMFDVLNHAVCQSSNGWSYGLRVICSDWGLELAEISSACAGGRVLVATACDGMYSTIIVPACAAYLHGTHDCMIALALQRCSIRHHLRAAKRAVGGDEDTQRGAVREQARMEPRLYADRAGQVAAHAPPGRCGKQHIFVLRLCVCPEPVLASRRLSYELTPRYLKKAP